MNTEKNKKNKKKLLQKTKKRKMKSSRARLERLTANAVVATVLGSIPASSDTVISFIKKKKKKGRMLKKEKGCGVYHKKCGV